LAPIKHGRKLGRQRRTGKFGLRSRISPVMGAPSRSPGTSRTGRDRHGGKRSATPLLPRLDPRGSD
jgi:hypothetical protein